jgi:tRNA threonylcarbamoyladenosine biosynthesis protein TsaB
LADNLLLINSNDKDAFAALSVNSNLNISKASEFTDESNPLEKKPDRLIHCIHKISKEHNLKVIDAIAVTIGPGSFTGIRVGLSIAKGLAFGLGKKIIPVNNFELILNRLPSINKDNQYCVLIPAKLPEYYYSVIRGNLYLKTGCTNMENLSEIVEKETMIVGDFDDETSIKHSYFEYNNVKNLKSELDSMLELAENNLNNAVNPEDIEPLYLKDFVIKKI